MIATLKPTICFLFHINCLQLNFDIEKSHIICFNNGNSFVVNGFFLWHFTVESIR